MFLVISSKIQLKDSFKFMQIITNIELQNLICIYENGEFRTVINIKQCFIVSVILKSCSLWMFPQQLSTMWQSKRDHGMVCNTYFILSYTITYLTTT